MTYKFVEVESFGKTKLIFDSETNAALVLDKTGEKFEIRGADGQPTSIDDGNSWRMVSAEVEEVDSDGNWKGQHPNWPEDTQRGWIVWQNQKTGEYQQSLYKIDSDNKQSWWEELYEPANVSQEITRKDVDPKELFELERIHSMDVNEDGVLSEGQFIDWKKALALKFIGPDGKEVGGRDDSTDSQKRITIDYRTFTDSDQKVKLLNADGRESVASSIPLGSWSADRHAKLSLNRHGHERDDTKFFDISSSGTLTFKKEPEFSSSDETDIGKYNVVIKAVDKVSSTERSQEVTIRRRELIMVTNNNDSGSGSFRDAITKGNRYAENGIPVEIAFKESMVISPTSTYIFLEGDWLINEYQTKNITIMGKNTADNKQMNGPLIQMGDRFYEDYHPRTNEGLGFPPLTIKMSGVNLSHANPWATNRGNGESLGPEDWGPGCRTKGAALLKLYGHLDYRDSVIQENKVTGITALSHWADTLEEGHRSEKLNGIDFLGNTAAGSKYKWNSFNDMFFSTRGVPVEIQSVRRSNNATNDNVERETLHVGTLGVINGDRNDWVAGNAHGTFFAGAEDEDGETPLLISATSYFVDKTKANIQGNSYQLDTTKDHVIYLATEGPQGDGVIRPTISGGEGLIKAVNKLNNHIHKTKSVAEIKGSRKSWFTPANIAGAAMALGQAGSVYQKLHPSKTKPSQLVTRATDLAMAGLDLVGGVPGAKAIAGIAKVGFSIFTHEMSENARIEEELQVKKETDAKRDAITNLLPKSGKLETQTFLEYGQGRTRETFNDFQIGKHTLHFAPGLNPQFLYKNNGSTQRDTIFIDHSDQKPTGDSSPKRIAILNLSEESTKELRKAVNKNGYFETLLHLLPTDNGEGEYMIGTQSQWKFQNSKQMAPDMGPAGDRVIVKRATGYNGDITTETFAGDDIIVGDEGNNEILAGVGNDYIQPKRGTDTIYGQEGRDLVSYIDLHKPISVTVNQEKTLKVGFMDDTSNSLDATLTSIEALKVMGGSRVDLTNAKRPVLDVIVIEEGDLARETFYTIEAGAAGTDITGSDYNDHFRIDFTDDFNQPTDDLIFRGTESKVDGGDGYDILAITGLGALKMKDNSKTFFLKTDRNEIIMKENGKKDCVLLSYENIEDEHVSFLDSELNANTGEITFTAAQLALISPNTDLL